MEAVLEATYSGTLSPHNPLSSLSRATGNLLRAVSNTPLKIVISSYLKALEAGIRHIPVLMKYIDKDNADESDIQAALIAAVELRIYYEMTENIARFFKENPILNSRQFNKFKSALREFREAAETAEAKVSKLADSTDSSPQLKYDIAGKKLITPLHIFIEDDDTGKHIDCREFPMLYGFGETEEEAIEMLDREILSLCEDAREFPDLPMEYKLADLLARLVMSNAQ